jgi:hypothetical protein
MISELCYYHVPEFEIECRKRAKIIPCIKYHDITSARILTKAAIHLPDEDFGRFFVAEDRGVIAVGVEVKNILFIGFRGTVFLYDWWINLRAPLVAQVITHNGNTGRFHRGFSEEALRIYVRIQNIISTWDEIRQNHRLRPNNIVLSGHSLGGAIAAICAPMISGHGSEKHTFIFGAPRYCDVTALLANPYSFPTQINRKSDKVPSIPPRRMGYVDCPWQYDTSGSPINAKVRSSELNFVHWRWTLFTAKGFVDHNIENYRHDLGKACSSPLCDNDFINLKA